MSVNASVVEPASGRLESALVAGMTVLIVLVAGVNVQLRGREPDQTPLLGWQISAFYDLNAADQAIYNALLAASDELWWAHGDLLNFGTEEQRADPWPTVEQLDQDYLMPPFARDVAWTQQGEVEWVRVASFSFEGSAAYFGSGGKMAGQSAYLLLLAHVHKGASYVNGATIWIHANPEAPHPTLVTRDSLIVNGWREVVPYTGATEVERLKGA